MAAIWTFFTRCWVLQLLGPALEDMEEPQRVRC
jgi:hypothetical protein